VKQRRGHELTVEGSVSAPARDFGTGSVPASQREKPSQVSEDIQDRLARHAAPSSRSVLSDLRFEIDVRHTAKGRRSCGRICDATPSAGRREGV
jgi:hypothetical protein